MALRIHFHPDALPASVAATVQHCLVLIPPPGRRLAAVVPAQWRAPVQAWLRRRGLAVDRLADTLCQVERPGGGLGVLCVLDPAASAYNQGTALRKALAPLLAEHPQALAIEGLHGADSAVVQRVVQAALVNAAVLPTCRQAPPPAALRHLHLVGVDKTQAASARAGQVLADANTLARCLTVLPPNQLTPAAYRARVARQARDAGWQHREHDLRALRRLKAGAFLAVAQGSPAGDAAIVHLSHRPRGAVARVVLVGKGICFDTGGHNLKSARYMQGMHEDMNGSAVALAAMQALVALKVPVEVHAFLALAENHLSPEAYRQNEVVTALNGTTIEIVHTDAEGRMVLADTLALASRERPDLLVDFATLTGAMVGALGTRRSGLFANRPGLAELAVAAGEATGERMVAFPMDEDYDAALETPVADIRQCLIAGEADHILAARFLSRFVGPAAGGAAKRGRLPDWIHVDLSSYRNPGGLGLVASDVTGYGVAWTVALVQRWLAAAAPA